MVFWTIVIIVAMKMSHNRKTSVLQDALENKMPDEKVVVGKDRSLLNRINQQRPISVRQTLPTGAKYGSSMRQEFGQSSHTSGGYIEVSPDTIAAEELYAPKQTVNEPQQSSYFHNKPRKLATKKYTIVKDINAEPKKEKVQRYEPEIIEGYEISNERGFYLVKVENSKALIGIVNTEVIVIKNFERLRYSKFIVKKTQGIDRRKDVFFVQIDNWRGLVSSTPKGMKLELVL